MLAALAFLYLWWFAILLFDLALLWHRYIRASGLVDNLGAWWRKRHAIPEGDARVAVPQNA